jgi:hypothetical protein
MLPDSFGCPSGKFFSPQGNRDFTASHARCQVRQSLTLNGSFWLLPSAPKPSLKGHRLDSQARAGIRCTFQGAVACVRARNFERAARDRRFNFRPPFGRRNSRPLSHLASEREAARQTRSLLSGCQLPCLRQRDIIGMANVLSTARRENFRDTFRPPKFAGNGRHSSPSSGASCSSATPRAPRL